MVLGGGSSGYKEWQENRERLIDGPLKHPVYEYIQQEPDSCGLSAFTLWHKGALPAGNHASIAAGGSREEGFSNGETD